MRYIHRLIPWVYFGLFILLLMLAWNLGSEAGNGLKEWQVL